MSWGNYTKRLFPGLHKEVGVEGFRAINKAGRAVVKRAKLDHPKKKVNWADYSQKSDYPSKVVIYVHFTDGSRSYYQHHPDGEIENIENWN